ncbi:putative phosphoenolpyruvate synthase isoform X1 [Manduca sexta]|uniref:putative phosphoenolpyruvate synthase isoform X1 n=1 Tax=Manduca sexta TaxID=7130 RepID=UPI00188EE723|nr:putative phosphoenolpyruvate synthase isoform X1 [Manduca sexta]
MDFFDILLQAGLITSALAAYLIFFRKPTAQKGNYKSPGWNYPLKLLVARYVVKRWKSQIPEAEAKAIEMPRASQHEGWDCMGFRASAPNGTTILLGIRKLCGRQSLAEVTVHVKLQDGTSYKLPQHPDTAVGAWVAEHDGWRTGGLKFQILEPELQVRILYNGPLTRVHDNVTQHAKMNFIWASVTKPLDHPKHWSNELAAQALALEPWRDDEWTNMLGKWADGSSLQWGAIQGRVQTFDINGVIDRSEYLQTRGVKERSWAPHGYEGVRRSFTLTAMARDGTGVMLRGISYKNILTQCLSGCVRFPDYTVQSIKSTNLIMSDFCETVEGVPKAYSINVKTKKRELTLLIRISPASGKLHSGVPYQQDFDYRTVEVVIDSEQGTGILELTYQPAEILQPSIPLIPAPLLNWLDEKQAGRVGYCLAFEDRAAACSSYVGGKGASLALLASVQKDEGYRVPPGFCLTIRALEQHLQANPKLRAAIREIEEANKNYDETNFKNKCEVATKLFESIYIPDDVRDEVLFQMKELRRNATEQNLGPELRFAVRSSAVGEDSEALSAAGQNETILGCISDEDVLKGIQKCWGSMFAFTSAYYRRQNGQACLCGGGVVVQALVAPRAAGVMFTRHPDAGDASRLLITANYGLGESVVSGAVEPDTIIIKREMDGRLSILKTDLGSKRQRVATSGSGVVMVDVPEDERRTACITEDEALKLARLGVAQEKLWGAGRDIEWAVTENDIFLLQARPITSLERWTDEELLHELDFPIMADDELTTFGNTGEVLPKPITPMSYDVMIRPLSKGMDVTIGTNGSGFDKSVIMTHNRCVLSMYNSIYKKAPKEIDINIRMVEMAINGHKVADEEILKTALHRRPPHWTDRLAMIWTLVKSLTTSKRRLNDSIKLATNLTVGEESKDVYSLLDELSKLDELVARFVYNHSITSTASTSSQFIVMTVLLEGSSEFTPELCNEIGTLLSVGDVLSAEVPQALARLARQLEQSGMFDAFRAQHPKDAMQWLKKNLPHVYLDVCIFLEHHGHRAIMEFDLSTKPWILVPEEMMKVLQNLRATPEETQKPKTVEETIASLKNTKQPKTLKILPWVLPLCRRTVSHREGTKAHLILGLHKIRLAFLRLADMLIQNWYLPNRDVIFFFRLHELQKYVQTRDPALLKKALQRQQYYASWSKLKFAEVNTGWVVPLETKGPSFTAGDVKIEGTSVCAGEVVARACVVKDLSEIGQLQQGDVLITHATDIGWSPYFPLLTGIVTELGGLISHGAVIAREYGLPCIVGAAEATDVFKTGDMVRLSGTNGVIERVKINDKSIECVDCQ